MWNISLDNIDNLGQGDYVCKAIKILRKIACRNGGDKIGGFYDYFTLYDLKKESHPLTLNGSKYKFGIWFDAYRYKTKTYLNAKQFLSVFLKKQKYVILNEDDFLGITGEKTIERSI